MDWLKNLFSDKADTRPEYRQTEFDAKSLATIEDRPKDEYTWYAVDPGIIYPATIERIVTVLTFNVYPEELNDPATHPQIDSRAAGRIILNAAAEIPAKGWTDALKPRDTFDNLKDAEAVKVRAAALDIARRWFTQALHVQEGGDGTPLGIHILENKPYNS